MYSWEERKKLKIILLGDSGVGKTSLTNRYNDKDFKKLHNSTIAADFHTKEICIAKETVTLNIWDTAGQERFNSITSWFYRDTDCCVLVYDINNLETFESVDKWHADFIKEVNPGTPDKFPFVLVGNKTDVNGGNSRVVAEEKAIQWCESKGKITYFETSAKEKSNVDEAFLEIAHKALSNEHNIDEWKRYKGEIAITVEEQQKRSCAC